MKALRILLASVMMLASMVCMAQKVHIKANNESLSTVIKRLNVEVSFDNKVLSQYKVNLDKTFPSAQAAINYLLADKPLKVQKVSGVYIITSRKAPPPKEKEKEKIPYKIVIKKLPDSLSMDIAMSLKEIVITSKSRTPSLNGENIDESSYFGAATANAMPGHSDNSVFNVLRMMPGIRASGEPSDELYVWGSSPGESRISLDGIPLFAMQSYNSNISYINPFMTDEVKYKRGILSADEGSMTGAKVDVLSGSSYLSKPTFKAMASTMSMNLFGAIPIGKKNLLSIAYRHTLNGVFSGTTFDAYRHKNDTTKINEHNQTVPANPTETNKTTTSTEANQNKTESTETHNTVTPEYTFQDLNVNLAGEINDNTSYKVTVYGAKDYLEYDAIDSIMSDSKQTSYQGGASAYLKKKWNNGSRSDLSTFFSTLHAEQTGRLFPGKENFNMDGSENLSQFNLKYEQSALPGIKGLALGGELTTYHVSNAFVHQSTVQPTLFANEKYVIGHLTAEAGLRTDMMKDGVKWQPRFLLKYRMLKYVSLTTSWGIYHQYLVKDPFAVFQNNYQFRWDINTALKSYNTVAGIAYDHGGFNVSAEAYLKKIHNSVWVINNTAGLYNFTLKGIDLSAKYNWRHGLLFTSWSLSDDPRQTDGKANEVKAGGILRYYPFTFSLNYIYGSGYNSMLLPTSSFQGRDGDNANADATPSSSTTYSRMDAYASYEKRFRLMTLTVGASVINIFDTENTKYVTSWMPRGLTSSLSSQASRFTPILFIELKF